MPCETKVSDFYVQAVIEKDVLWFQVSMNDVSWVDVVDTFKDLSHDEACLLFWKCHDRCEVIEEFTVTAEFEHQENEGIRLKDILKLN